MSSPQAPGPAHPCDEDSHGGSGHGDHHDQAHSHHGHSHNHHHSHSHGHSHNHNHDHVGSNGSHEFYNEDAADPWSGDKYLADERVQAAAVVNMDHIVYSLKQVGYSESEMAKMNVLEVGSGAGTVTQHLSKVFASVHCVDTSTNMLLSLSTHAGPNVSYSLYTLTPDSALAFTQPLPSPTPDESARSLVPPRRQFDLVVVNLVLHHIDAPKPFMQGIKGLMAPGGWLVITEFGVEDGETGEWAEKRRHGHLDANSSAAKPGHLHAAHTPASITNALQSFGFDQVTAELRGKLPLTPNEAENPPCLVVRARKPE